MRDAMNLTAETAAKVTATKHQDFFGHDETKWFGNNLWANLSDVSCGRERHTT
jgi:hypothetical protein